MYTSTWTQIQKEDKVLLYVSILVISFHFLFIASTALLPQPIPVKPPKAKKIVVQTVKLNKPTTVIQKEIKAAAKPKPVEPVAKEIESTPEPVVEKAVQKEPEPVTKEEVVPKIEQPPVQAVEEVKPKVVEKVAPKKSTPVAPPKPSVKKEVKAAPKKNPPKPTVEKPKKTTPKPSPKKDKPKEVKKPPKPVAKPEATKAKPKTPSKQVVKEAAPSKPKVDPQAEAAKVKRRELLASAQKNIAKIEHTRDKLGGGEIASLAATVLPGRIESLQVETFPESTSALTSQEMSYYDELASRLKLQLRLPEYGEVRIKLTLNRSGQFVKVSVTSTESATNRKHVEKTIPTLKFPSFGNNFKDIPEYTFVISLSNE